VEELKGLLQNLWPLVVLAAVVLLRGLFRTSARDPQTDALGMPPGDPTPTLLQGAHRAEVSSAKGPPELPREPEASRASQRNDPVPERPPAAREPTAADAGHRLRRLLAHAEGRRVALLVHEVFRPPEGCGRT